MNELAQLDDTLECCNLSLGLFLSKVRGGMIPQLYITAMLNYYPGFD